MDMETGRELKTDLQKTWKPGKSVDVSREKVSYLKMESKREELTESNWFIQLENLGDMGRLRDIEKHQERMREIERRTDIARHEIRESEKLRQKQRQMKHGEEMLNMKRDFYERQSIIERRLEEKIRQMEERERERVMKKEWEESQHQESQTGVKDTEHRFPKERQIEEKRHEESLIRLESRCQQEWEEKILELERKLVIKEEMSKKREEQLLRQLEQEHQTKVGGVRKTWTEMERNTTMKSLTGTHMVRDLDLQGGGKHQTEENDSERELYERQIAMRKQEMIERERDILSDKERRLQMEEQLKKMERKFEMEREMERKSHEERWMKIEEKQKEWEKRTRELEGKLEEERQAAQKREQELLKDIEEEEETAKESELMKMEKQKETGVEEKRTTGVEKLINRGKEWMREIKQKVEKKKDVVEARLQDGEGFVDEQEVKDKDSEKDGKSMAELEKPVKGIEWLREFRLKEEKMYDPGQEILVEEERQERKTRNCGQMEVRREVERKEEELVDGEMGQKRSEKRLSDIKKKRQKAEEMLRKPSEIKMEGKTSTDKEEKIMTVMKTLETTKTNTLKTKGMEWLEEVRQDSSERVSERKMEGKQLERETQFDNWFGEIDRKFEKEREMEQKRSEERWSELRSNQRRRVENTQELHKKNEKEIKGHELVNQTEVDQKTNEERPVDMEKRIIGMEIKPAYKKMPWQDDIKQNMKKVKDSDKDFHETCGIMDDKRNDEKRVIINRRQREGESKDEAKQVKKEELLDDWFGEKEHKTTDETLRELREKRQKRLEEKTQEMEKKKEKEREMVKKQLARQREVEQKAKIIRELLTDTQGDTEEKEKGQKIERQEMMENGIKNRRGREISGDEDCRRKEQLTEGNGRSRYGSSGDGMDVKIEMQQEMDIHIEERKWKSPQTKLEEQTLESQKQLKNERGILMKKDIQLVRQCDSGIKHHREDKGKSQEDKKKPKEEAKESSPNDKMREEVMSRRQRLTQNSATTEVVETPMEYKMERTIELQTDERELIHNPAGWQKQSSVLEITREKESERQRELEREWDKWEENANQERERQRKEREEQERERQKEKEKHLEIQKQKELEQQKKWETDIKQKEDMERQSAQEEVSPEQRQEKDRAKMVLKTQIQSIEKPTRVTGQRLVCQTDEIEKVRNNLLRKESKLCHSTIQATCHRKPRVIHVKSFIQNDTDQRPNPAESLPDTEPTSTTDDLKLIHQVIDSKQDENNTMIPSKEGPRGDPNFCQVLDIELDDDDSGITPLTGSVIPKSEVESCCKSDSDESVYEKTKRLEIEKLKKGNVAFMPLEKEDEHQGTTKQQLPQDSVYPFKAHSYDPDVRREGGEDEEEMNASPCLEDTYSQKELPDATEHNETGMEGEGEKKDKSVRRRLFRWVNDKAKNYYNNKIDRTIRREAEEGKSTYQPCKISNFLT